MDFIAVIVLLVFFVALGYLLGIVGFFRAGAALEEVRQLRALLMQEIARRDAADREVPQARPGPVAPTPPAPAKPIFEPRRSVPRPPFDTLYDPSATTPPPPPRQRVQVNAYWL